MSPLGSRNSYHDSRRIERILEEKIRVSAENTLDSRASLKKAF